MLHTHSFNWGLTYKTFKKLSSGQKSRKPFTISSGRRDFFLKGISGKNTLGQWDHSAWRLSPLAPMIPPFLSLPALSPKLNMELLGRLTSIQYFCLIPWITGFLLKGIFLGPVAGTDSQWLYLPSPPMSLLQGLTPQPPLRSPVDKEKTDTIWWFERSCE